MSDFARLQELARASGVAVNPPMNTTVPYVSPEAAMVGETLSCTMGEWSGEPTEYAYRWLSDGQEVGTGTSASYATAAPGVVNCIVTATNAAGSAAAQASNAATVTAAATGRTAPAPDATRTRKTHTETTR